MTVARPKTVVQSESPFEHLICIEAGLNFKGGNEGGFRTLNHFLI
jgi:hypothetical protein